MQLSSFDYELPRELIAQNPAEPRDSAKLLVYERASDTIVHAHVYDIPAFIKTSTAFAANNSKVRHSRLHASLNGKETEVLVIEPTGTNEFRCLLRGKGIANGSILIFFSEQTLQEKVHLAAIVLRREDVPGMTTFILSFTGDGSIDDLIERYGALPLPPYIIESTAEESRYQTVYAKETGSAAAPTAGLHFTPDLINRLKQAGATWEEVTLHVGLGTFLPLRNATIEKNRLHAELTNIETDTAKRLTETRSDGKPLIAIGTTSMRTLESHWEYGSLQPGWKPTDMFIYPGYTFKAATGLLTNFHLPKSSLLLLVAAFLGNTDSLDTLTKTPEEMTVLLMKLYSEAIRLEYKFFSFGDAMLIL